MYSNILLYMRAFWIRCVDTAKILHSCKAKYSTLNKGWIQFEHIIFYHIASDTISKKPAYTFRYIENCLINFFLSVYIHLKLTSNTYISLSLIINH